MAEPPIIDSDETVRPARRLAERLGTTPDDAVAQALLAYDECLWGCAPSPNGGHLFRIRRS